eukprot:TRINITY_DN6001_c0_g1_i1.p1 TRINITY_DN6001_c0_g1~~TRINITY_DN6001_c0_g1_i1.p1  ORF type:complete len:1206 (+),score=206.63 TRINITY_DN6001_c0_g1_i1:57-3620(+)
MSLQSTPRNSSPGNSSSGSEREMAAMPIANPLRELQEKWTAEMSYEPLEIFDQDTAAEKIVLDRMDIRDIEKLSKEKAAQRIKTDKILRERHDNRLTDVDRYQKKSIQQVKVKTTGRIAEERIKYNEAKKRKKITRTNIQSYFQQSNTRLKTFVKMRKSQVLSKYGEMTTTTTQQYELDRVDWDTITQQVEVHVTAVRGLKDKVKASQYAIVLSKYTQLGGDLFKWSLSNPPCPLHDLEPSSACEVCQGWVGCTTPATHGGTYSDVDLVLDTSVFTFFPPKKQIKPYATLVFELVRLPEPGDTDPPETVGWGAFPVINGKFSVVKGKFKTPLLRGAINNNVCHYTKINDILMSDMENWLANLYFEVVPHPRECEELGEFDIEATMNAKRLGISGPEYPEPRQMMWTVDADRKGASKEDLLELLKDEAENGGETTLRIPEAAYTRRMSRKRSSRFVKTDFHTTKSFVTPEPNLHLQDIPEALGGQKGSKKGSIFDLFKRNKSAGAIKSLGRSLASLRYIGSKGDKAQSEAGTSEKSNLASHRGSKASNESSLKPVQSMQKNVSVRFGQLSKDEPTWSFVYNKADSSADMTGNMGAYGSMFCGGKTKMDTFGLRSMSVEDDDDNRKVQKLAQKRRETMMKEGKQLDDNSDSGTDDTDSNDDSSANDSDNGILAMDIADKEEGELLFDLVDEDGDGVLTISELSRYFEKFPEIKTRLGVDELDTFFYRLDTNHDGIVDRKEFASHWAALASGVINLFAYQDDAPNAGTLNPSCRANSQMFGATREPRRSLRGSRGYDEPNSLFTKIRKAAGNKKARRRILVERGERWTLYTTEANDTSYLSGESFSWSLQLTYCWRGILDELSLTFSTFIVLVLCLYSQLFLHGLGKYAAILMLGIPTADIDPRPMGLLVTYDGNHTHAFQELCILLLAMLTTVLIVGIIVLISLVVKVMTNSLPDQISKFVYCLSISWYVYPLIHLVISLCGELESRHSDVLRIIDFYSLNRYEPFFGLATFLTLYFNAGALLAVINYLYTMRIHLNGILQDCFWRINIANDRTSFIPMDLEVSIRELSYTCMKAERWRGKNGERRKVCVSNLITTDDGDDEYLSKQVHIEIYTLDPFVKMPDGSMMQPRKMYREFYVMSDGAVVEMRKNRLPIAVPIATEKVTRKDIRHIEQVEQRRKSRMSIGGGKL